MFIYSLYLCLQSTASPADSSGVVELQRNAIGRVRPFVSTVSLQPTDQSIDLHLLPVYGSRPQFVRDGKSTSCVKTSGQGEGS